MASYMSRATDQIMIRDDRAMQFALNDLGWVGRDPNSPEVSTLRDYLSENNGIKELEVLRPDEIEKATRLFYRDGFVVVRNALDAKQLDFLRGGCDRVIHQMMAQDRDRVGNRGSHRYSFGAASETGAQMHNPEWSMLVDLPTITPILTSIFGSADYIARGGGGDFCLPGAVEYQGLHSDMGDRREVQLENGRTFTSGSFKDPRGFLTYRDLPCPYVSCNYLMVDFTRTNGPIRQIPGTQHSRQPIPTLDEEPEWMKLSAVCPAPAGGVVIRDVRAWHGGTPNLSNEVRAIPNAEFFAPWFREPIPRSITRKIHDGLSEHGKDICRYIAAAPGEVLNVGIREDLGYFRRQQIKK